MRARYIIESERWSEMKGQTTFDNIDELFALGLSAVNLGDAARVRSVIDELRKASAPAQPAELREQAEVMLREMEALDLFAQGRHAEAFAAMDRAVGTAGAHAEADRPAVSGQGRRRVVRRAAAAGGPRRRRRSRGSIAR